MPLDAGRTRRLYSAQQRIALQQRDRHCTAAGCATPPALCHAHHDQPWSTGGPTDLANGRLLCGHHHRRVHDPAFRHERHPDGTIRFHRRE
ncbi:HNH endonuclease signature motif containing protein [Nocardioides korecus]